MSLKKKDKINTEMEEEKSFIRKGKFLVNI